MIRFGPGLKRVNGDQKYVASGTCGVQSKLPLLCGNGIKNAYLTELFPQAYLKEWCLFGMRSNSINKTHCG